MKADNPYRPPDLPPEPAQPTVRVTPFWVMRTIFAVSATMLFVDAFTRNRPELRPVWLGTVCVAFELLLAVTFAMLTFGRFQSPEAQSIKID